MLSLLTLIVTCSSTWAGDKPVITVDNVEALPGETVSFVVNLTDGKADTYTAMTLYANFPTTGFTTTGEYTVSSAWAGASATVGDITPSGLATIPFASSNVITGSLVDGLVTVAVKVDDGLAVGDYPVTLSGTMFEYNASDKDYADDVTFYIKVVDRITLDENSTIAPIARTGVNVTVNRTIHANEWSTICLPFELAAADAKTVFGDDVQIMRFSSYEAEIDNTSNKINAINLNFTKHTKKLQVGTPYMIRTTKEIHNFNRDNVNISETVSYTNVEIENDNLDYTGTFKGTFSKTKVPNNGLFISGNKFYYSAGKTNIMAFRGWFELEAILDETVSANANINITFDDETTGIKEIHGSNKSVEGTYDLQGRKVEEPANKGLYIVNGKKVVKK